MTSKNNLGTSSEALAEVPLLLMLTIRHFFVGDKDSVIEVMNAFDKFSLISALKPNKAKCEIAGIGALKGITLALCGRDFAGLKRNN